MTTNEIEKLKTEHARYKRALETLSVAEVMTLSKTHSIVDDALYPPTPPPVTLEDLKAALKRYSDWNNSHSVNFYKDESGCIRNGHEERVFGFRTLREAVDFLTREN